MNKKTRNIISELSYGGWKLKEMTGNEFEANGHFSRHVDMGDGLSDELIIKYRIYYNKPLDRSYILPCFKEDKITSPILYTDELKLFSKFINQIWKRYNVYRKERR